MTTKMQTPDPAGSEQKSSLRERLRQPDLFVRRHIGPREQDIRQMATFLGYPGMDALIDAAVPASIRLKRPLDIGASRSEYVVLSQLRDIASQNKVFRSYIGMGYHDCITPPVIQRNILENPGWYTQYTPYQPEISQGRLEALLNFQTMIADLTGLEIANASLLDEATAAAEAMNMSRNLSRSDANAFFVSDACHPQTIAVVQTRARALGIEVIVGDHETFDFSTPVFGVLVQYPATDGTVHPYGDFVKRAHEHGALVTVAADLLALALLVPPGDMGADIAVGNTQRFGVPLGYGGPHAAYLRHARGVQTADARPYRRCVQGCGREPGAPAGAADAGAAHPAGQGHQQHLHGPGASCGDGFDVRRLPRPGGSAQNRRTDPFMTALLARGLRALGCNVAPEAVFDTLRVETGENRCAEVEEAARALGINLRRLDARTVGVSLNETTSAEDLRDLLSVFSPSSTLPFDMKELADETDPALPENLKRTSPYLKHPVFNRYHSETELLRYIHRLQARDLSLTTSMIPLGSCTMKLNATVEMFPVSWPEFAKIHPFAPVEQARGYQILFGQLEQWLAEITGFSAISLQPNAGSQGEYTGLLVIRKYQESRGEGHRHICLIPQSAHGTNPASAVMAGLNVVVVACDQDGNIDVPDLKAKAAQHAAELAALMVTYPSTHGVFEEAIREICDTVHASGGQVYMDGANMNAQVGLCRPAEIGADVCHLNLHKTFSIPHGGGGPGMGPIGVRPHLAPFLPRHPVIEVGGPDGIGPVARQLPGAAPASCRSRGCTLRSWVRRV